jgi:hypothetical protein
MGARGHVIEYGARKGVSRWGQDRVSNESEESGQDIGLTGGSKDGKEQQETCPVRNQHPALCVTERLLKWKHEVLMP